MADFRSILIQILTRPRQHGIKPRLKLNYRRQPARQVVKSVYRDVAEMVVALRGNVRPRRVLSEELVYFAIEPNGQDTQ
jgi:hypothetical protein